MTQPNPIDLHVGERVRLRRRAIGVSQETLADGLKLTFQQVQKYERGANRISASKLHQIAQLLGVPAGWFFDGLDQPDEPERVSLQIVADPHGFILARDYISLPQDQRKIVAELARSLAQANV